MMAIAAAAACWCCVMESDVMFCHVCACLAVFDVSDIITDTSASALMLELLEERMSCRNFCPASSQVFLANPAKLGVSPEKLAG